VVVACWLLVAVDCGYFLLRAKRWQHRQALEYQEDYQKLNSKK
jgi:hypothetical protein